jgi:hypothetical protein
VPVLPISIGGPKHDAVMDDVLGDEVILDGSLAPASIR